MGFGQSGGEKASTSGINNVFNYAMPAAKAGQTAGRQNLGDADAFFRSLLTSGRAETGLNSAPAVNAVQDQADVVRRASAEMGTARGGGTAEANREAGASTTKTIDDIINENLVGGRVKGAEGEAGLGRTNLGDAAQLLGLGQQGQEALYQGAIQKIGSQTAGISGLAGDVAGAALYKALFKAPTS